MPPYIKPIPYSGGVNLFADPRLIEEGEVLLSRNLFPKVPGVLSKRGSVRVTPAVQGGEPYILGNSNFIIPPFEGSIAGVSSGRRIIAPDAFTSVYATTPDGFREGTWGSTVDEQTVTPLLDRRLFMFAFLGKVYTLGGSPWTIPALVTEDVGGTITTAPFAFDGTGNTDIHPRVAGIYRERVVWADLGPGLEDHLLFSDPFQPGLVGDDSLAADGRGIRVGSRAGDRIVAVLEVSQGGLDMPSTSALLILRQHSAYLLTGEPSHTDDDIATVPLLGDLEISRINIDTGCVSAETVVRTERGVLWASNSDVWIMPANGLPYTVGTKIRPALTRAPALDAVNWHASYFNGIYRLVVHGENQGPLNDTSTVDAAVADSLHDQWWLDLRGGAPKDWSGASWYGPMQFNLFSNQTTQALGSFPSVPDLRPGVPLTLRSVVHNLASSGSALIVEYDSPGEVDGIILDAFPPDHGFIFGELKLKTQTSDGMTDLRFLSLEARIRIALETHFRVDVSMDDARRTDHIVKTLTNSGFQLDVNTVPGSFASPFQVTSFYPSSNMVGKDLSLTLTDTPALVITATNKHFLWNDDSTFHRCVLTEGVYLTPLALGVAVAEAIDRAIMANYNVASGFYAVYSAYLTGTAVTLEEVGGFGGAPVVNKLDAVNDYGTQITASNIYSPDHVFPGLPPDDAEFAENTVVWNMLGFVYNPSPGGLVWTADDTVQQTDIPIYVVTDANKHFLWNDDGLLHRATLTEGTYFTPLQLAAETAAAINRSAQDDYGIPYALFSAYLVGGKVTIEQVGAYGWAPVVNFVDSTLSYSGYSVFPSGPPTASEFTESSVVWRMLGWVLNPVTSTTYIHTADNAVQASPPGSLEIGAIVVRTSATGRRP